MSTTEKVRVRKMWESWFSSEKARMGPVYVYANILVLAESLMGGVVDKDVLEVGCGRGATLLEFAKRGARVTGLDYSEAALRASQAIIASDGDRTRAAFVLGDAECLPFPNQNFDLVYSVGVLEHFADLSAALREQSRVLRGGGYMIVQVPQKYSFYTVVKKVLMVLNRWPYGGWETQYSAGELTDLVTVNGFIPCESYGCGSFVLAVARHFGLRSLDFNRNSTFWRQGPYRRWIRAHTALEVGVVGRKPQVG